MQRFNEKKIDLQLVKNEVLSEFLCNEGKIIKINEIAQSVLPHFNISRICDQLHSNKEKIKSIAFPRPEYVCI